MRTRKLSIKLGATRCRESGKTCATETKTTEPDKKKTCVPSEDVKRDDNTLRAAVAALALLLHSSHANEAVVAATRILAQAPVRDVH